MNCYANSCRDQEIFNSEVRILPIPSRLPGLCKLKIQSFDESLPADQIVLAAEVEDAAAMLCPHCQTKMYFNQWNESTLQHTPFGSNHIVLHIQRKQFRCPCCQHIQSQHISCKAPGKRITTELYQRVIDLLEEQTMTLTAIAKQTGIDRKTVRAIDKERLTKRHKDKDGQWKRPRRPSRTIGIDEFLLHKGHQYATLIVDMETKEILWIAHGKKKQVVFDFMDHVGTEFMKGIESVSCDMNSDFQEAFCQRYPHIQIVYDRFHIVKNFNEKVISEVRKDEQQRLTKEGRIEEAKMLKNTKYLLMSNRETLRKKDEARNKKDLPFRKQNKPDPQTLKQKDLFEKPIKSLEEKLNELLRQNKLFFTADLIKEKLQLAYTTTDVDVMAQRIEEVCDLCYETKNARFIRFAEMLDNHFDGIVTHADYPVSNGKLEGINNKIKTLRRQGYGYPDDDYFFLKIVDAFYDKKSLTKDFLEITLNFP